MRKSFKIGLSFGATSGIITTLGLIMGLHSGTHSKLIIVGGILIIAIADAFSDALGIHVSEEAGKKPPKQVWESTISTFVAKFIFALTFIIPILLLELRVAIIASVLWGLLMVGITSFYVARENNANHLKVIAEHIFITIIVILISDYLGDKISLIFGI